MAAKPPKFDIKIEKTAPELQEEGLKLDTKNMELIAETETIQRRTSKTKSILSPIKEKTAEEIEKETINKFTAASKDPEIKQDKERIEEQQKKLEKPQSLFAQIKDFITSKTPEEIQEETIKKFAHASKNKEIIESKESISRNEEELKKAKSKFNKINLAVAGLTVPLAVTAFLATVGSIAFPPLGVAIIAVASASIGLSHFGACRKFLNWSGKKEQSIANEKSKLCDKILECEGRDIKNEKAILEQKEKIKEARFRQKKRSRFIRFVQGVIATGQAIKTALLFVPVANIVPPIIDAGLVASKVAVSAASSYLEAKNLKDKGKIIDANKEINKSLGDTEAESKHEMDKRILAKEKKVSAAVKIVQSAFTALDLSAFSASTITNSESAHSASELLEGAARITSASEVAVDVAGEKTEEKIERKEDARFEKQLENTKKTPNLERQGASRKLRANLEKTCSTEISDTKSATVTPTAQESKNTNKGRG